MTGNRGGVDLGAGWGHRCAERTGGKGGCGQDVMCERRIKRKKKDGCLTRPTAEAKL